jgi:hypothetical protein
MLDEPMLMLGMLVLGQCCFHDVLNHIPCLL